MREHCFKMANWISIVVLFTLLPSVLMKDEQATGVFGKIKSGLHMASKLLGLDAASGVAQLVAETFGGGTKAKKGDSADDQNHTLFSGFFRLLGLDAGKLGAIAINGFIFLAQLISTSLSIKQNPKITYAKFFDNDSPLQWFYNNGKLTGLINSAKDKNLPERLIDYVQERTMDEETACVQLLICKGAPLLRGMQKRIAVPADRADPSHSNLSGAAPMFLYLPTIEQVADHGDECERKFPWCRIMD